MRELYNYLALGENDEKWGLYITVAGYAEIPPNEIYPPQGHPSGYYFNYDNGRILNEYQLNIISKGEGILETKHGHYKLKAGSVFILFPGEWHRYKPNFKTGWKEHYVGLNGSYIKHLHTNGFLKENSPVFQVNYSDIVIDLFHKITDEIELEKPGYQQICAGILVQMLGHLNAAKISKEFEGKETLQVIQDAKLYLRERLNTNVDIKVVADELNIGYSYFRKAFKNYTGISPGQYHLTLRLQKARDLIISSDMSIKAIALELGFQSIFYFTRIFKKKMGINPSELRKQIK